MLALYLFSSHFSLGDSSGHLTLLIVFTCSTVCEDIYLLILRKKTLPDPCLRFKAIHRNSWYKCDLVSYMCKYILHILLHFGLNLGNLERIRHYVSSFILSGWHQSLCPFMSDSGRPRHLLKHQGIAFEYLNREMLFEEGKASL